VCWLVYQWVFYRNSALSAYRSFCGREVQLACCKQKAAQRRSAATGGVRGQCPPKFCCAQKFFYWTYNENKNTAPIKMYFSPPNPKTWQRAWFNVTLYIYATSSGFVTVASKVSFLSKYILLAELRVGCLKCTSFSSTSNLIHLCTKVL